MSNFAILRTKKLKTGVAVKLSMRHSFREQETPNADSERTAQNEFVGAKSSDEAIEKFNARLPERIRKNGVVAIEYLVTASPEAMKYKSLEDQNKYFNDAYNWLINKHGAENVICAGIHRDETTPHMYAYVVPIDERGKLNCRKFLGGPRAMIEMQDDFANTVGLKNELSRGKRGSKARHQDVKKYYEIINQELPNIENLFSRKEIDDRKKHRAELDKEFFDLTDRLIGFNGTDMLTGNEREKPYKRWLDLYASREILFGKDVTDKIYTDYCTTQKRKNKEIFEADANSRNARGEQALKSNFKMSKILGAAAQNLKRDGLKQTEFDQLKQLLQQTKDKGKEL